MHTAKRTLIIMCNSNEHINLKVTNRYIDVFLFFFLEKETPSDGAVYSECNIAISFLSILLVISVGLNILLKCRMSSRCICLSDQAIAQEHTGQENYDNLSDTKATHLYTTMTITK